ncbi:MAG TPA: hypothetical protein VLE70_18840 [Anaerolineae bacterium]|jgi:cytochrome c peroxidase|nr:hypothetical protein [Anaerolineae bacterium]
MSERSNGQENVAWAEKPVTLRGKAVFAGILAVTGLVTGALLYYVLTRPQDSMAEVEATPASPSEQSVEEEVVVEYPPLAVLPQVSFPPDSPYSLEKAELGEMLYFDGRMSADTSL